MFRLDFWNKIIVAVVLLAALWHRSLRFFDCFCLLFISELPTNKFVGFSLPRLKLAYPFDK
jgi:hypothetical protein